MIPYPYQTLNFVGETDRHWRFLCPFHKETQGSFTVNKGSQFPLHFRCWGCGEYGSPQHFAKSYLGHESPIIKETLNAGRKWDRELKQKDINWDAMRGCPLHTLPGNRKFLARKVGISEQTIDKFGIGWYCNRYTSQEFYTIPMYEDRGICGVATRSYVGEECVKKCRRYSKHGWFLPKESIYVYDKPTFIAEGWSDTATIVELGFQAIGKFNATHIGFPPDWDRNTYYIISDTDECGLKGARKLQKLIGGKIIVPIGFKDIRAMYLQTGKEATRKWIEKQL